MLGSNEWISQELYLQNFQIFQIYIYSFLTWVFFFDLTIYLIIRNHWLWLVVEPLVVFYVLIIVDVDILVLLFESLTP